jgi:F-type H+/Na+-transporting ATPase subunit alpha
VAGTLKIDLAQFRELEAFASFGSELDKVSQSQLDRGYRLTELLKQPLRSPMPVEEQVISIFAGTRGFIDDIPTGDVGRFEAELLEEFRSRHRELLDQIRNEGKLPDEGTINEAIKGFKERFTPSDDTADKRDEEETEEREEAKAGEQAQNQAEEEGKGAEPPGGPASDADAPAPG